MSNGSSSDRDSEDSREPETTRPNRWQGPASTWRDITKDERGLAASLDTLRDQNLSIHLFNAHSLKRKAREFEDAESSGLEISQMQDTRRFVPPKVWVAWPLPPEDVPRTEEEIGEEDELEVYTLKRKENNWPSSELEEVLTAVSLKQAKEMFRSRDLDAETIESQRIDNSNSIGSPAVGLEDHQDESDESDEFRDPSPGSSQDEGTRRSGSISSSRPELEAKRNLRKPPNHILQSVVSTDDDRSFQLLRPSIRHTLSKLDDLLMALHHARNTCHQYSRSDPGTDDEGRAMSVASLASEDGKRPVGRPRKFRTIRTGIEEPEPELTSPTPSQLLRTKKTHLGRPKKVYPRLENEMQQEYLVRIARMQKKPLPSFAPPLESRPSPSTSPSRQHRVPAHKATEEELFVSRNKKLGLRDWSEVIGAAALAGFDPGVIERATQRCATLFGESMTMRTLVETSFAESKDLMDLYQPELIPDFGVEESEEDSDFGNPSSSHEIRTKRSTRNLRAPSRCCPVSSCTRGHKPFRDNYSLQRHLRSVHKISHTAQNSAGGGIWENSVPSDEEMEGGIHVDGFLKPLKSIFREPRESKKRKTAVNTSSRESQSPLHGSAEDVPRDDSVVESDTESENEKGDSLGSISSSEDQ